MSTTQAETSAPENVATEEIVEIGQNGGRVWEVDFLRGFMILFVIWDHFMWDVGSIGTWQYKTNLFNWLYDLQSVYYAGALRKTTHDTFVTLFVFTSGVSCSFSRNNGKRALKMIALALLLTAATYAASSILNVNVTIYFNVLHVIALSVLLWACLEWISSKCNSNWSKNLFGWSVAAVIVAVLVVGYCAKTAPWTNESQLWFFLAKHSLGTPGFVKFAGVDYLPFFPDFGWFLVGGYLGKWLYKDKKTLFPAVNPKYVSPVTFCGKYSLWIYFGSQLFMYGFIYLFHSILNWL